MEAEDELAYAKPGSLEDKFRELAQETDVDAELARMKKKKKKA